MRAPLSSLTMTFNSYCARSNSATATRRSLSNTKRAGCKDRKCVAATNASPASRRTIPLFEIARVIGDHLTERRQQSMHHAKGVTVSTLVDVACRIRKLRHVREHLSSTHRCIGNPLVVEVNAKGSK